MARFTGTAVNDRYVFATGENVGFTVTNPALPNAFLAGAGNDYINLAGSTSSYDVLGGAGLDTLKGGAGSDRFLIGAPSDLVAGETYDGGRFMPGAINFNRLVLASTMASAETYDFRSVNLLNIHGFDFSASPSAAGGARTAIINAEQIQPAYPDAPDPKISPTLQVTGSLGNDAIIVNIGTSASVYLEGWTFSNWTPTNDVIVVQGSAAADTIRGTLLKDEILGGAGNDIIFGNAGNDIYNGQSGIDTVVLFSGFATSVTLDASGNATTSIGLGTIRLFSIENLVGGYGNDQFVGNAAANRLEGEEGDDILQGRGGNDVLFGGGRNDILQGGDGADQLDGGSEDDTLFGDNGNDRLEGGFGNDTLNGGAGNDIFVMESDSGGGGDDRIDGFQDGLDRIDMIGSSAGSFSQMSIAQVGANTVVTYGDVNTITLTGIAASKITAVDLIF